MFDYVTAYLRLVPANPERSTNIFGLSEFFTVLAIAIVAYSFSEETYKFRVNLAKFPIRQYFPYLFCFIGFSVVLSELYFELQLPVPLLVNNILIFETSYAAISMLAISYWLIIAFSRPPKFNRRNSLKYEQQVFWIILEGNEAQLLAAATEIARSAKEIVEAAHKTKRSRDVEKGGFRFEEPDEAISANAILSMMGDRRFCKVVAKQAPGVAAMIFRELSRQKLGRIRAAEFARNVTRELISFEDSVLHSEDGSFYSGFFGEHKPITNELFSDYELIESMASQGFSPVDIDLGEDWTVKRLSAYFRTLQIFFSSFLDSKFRNQHSYSVNNLMRSLSRLCYGVEKLNHGGRDEVLEAKIGHISDFIFQNVQHMEKLRTYPDAVRKRHKSKTNDAYRKLADLSLALLIEVARIEADDFSAWNIQRNTVWTNLFSTYQYNKAQSIFTHILRRLIYDEIVSLERFPDPTKLRLLGLCLYIMGLNKGVSDGISEHHNALKIALLRWTECNLLKLISTRIEFKKYIEVGTIRIDIDKKIIMKSYRPYIYGDPHVERMDLLD